MQRWVGCWAGVLAAMQWFTASGSRYSSRMQQPSSGSTALSLLITAASAGFSYLMRSSGAVGEATAMPIIDSCGQPLVTTWVEKRIFPSIDCPFDISPSPHTTESLHCPPLHVPSVSIGGTMEYPFACSEPTVMAWCMKRIFPSIGCPFDIFPSLCMTELSHQSSACMTHRRIDIVFEPLSPGCRRC